MRLNGLWLAAAGVIISCSYPALAEDILLVNGRVFTANPAAPYAEAVAVRDGKILAVGSVLEVSKVVDRDADAIDLGGKMLLPGLIDAHVHALQAGYAMISATIPPDLNDLEGLRAYAGEQARNPRAFMGEVLVLSRAGGTLDPATFDMVFNSAPFDNREVLVVGTSGHDAWANDVLLARADVTKDFIAGLSETQRELYGHDADLTPNGYVVDAGMDRVTILLPVLAKPVLVDSARAAITEMNRLGVTAWMEPLINHTPVQPALAAWPTADEEGTAPAYRELEERGELTGRVTGLVLLNADSGPEQVDVYSALAGKFPASERFQISGIKIFGDGAGDQLTPAIEHTNFKALVQEADRRGALVHVHALGHEAVTSALDAFQAVRTARPESSVPHSITHLHTVKVSDIQRFGSLDIIAVMQLLWAGSSYDNGASGLEDRTVVSYPARSIADAGGIIAGASDWYVSSANPFEAIAEGMARSGMTGQSAQVESLSAEDLLYAYTRNAAAAVGRPNTIGSIEVGKEADLILVDRDITRIPAEEVAKTKVLWTMFAGSFVYRSADQFNLK